MDRVDIITGNDILRTTRKISLTYILQALSEKHMAPLVVMSLVPPNSSTWFGPTPQASFSLLLSLP